MLLFSSYSFPANGIGISREQDPSAPKKKKHEYRHILVLGANRPFSGGSNAFTTIVAYFWFGENFADPDLYTEFRLTTTRIAGIVGVKTDRVFAGVKPMLEHSTYSGWRSYNRGYDDKTRDIRGSNAGMGVFFRYTRLRILSTTVAFFPSYYFYKLPVLTPNKNKYIQTPNSHFQIKPSLKITLSDVADKSLGRIKHGYLLEVEYQYARRIGYGTWYDYDRLFYKEKYEGRWILPAAAGLYQGIWYKSTITDTQRLYISAGGYYNFTGDYNLLFDFYGGWFQGVDRNNAEQIGYFLADYAVMPGYFDTEFYSHLYLIGRLRFGIPLPFWNARIQPGYNLLYMPGKNEVVGVGRGAMANSNWWLVRGYPRKFYTSVSCEFSIQLGNLLPLFMSYAYGIDARRARSSYDVYYSRIHLAQVRRGNHEAQAYVAMAFGKND